MMVHQQAPKTQRIRITGLKVRPELPPDFAEKTWTQLGEAVQAIHKGQSLNTCMELLYRAVENMCIHKMAEPLYNNLKSACNDHIGRLLTALTEHLVLEPIPFLQYIDKTWQEHCQQMKRIASIFLYLDRTYVLYASGMKSLFDMGLNLFRHHLSLHPQVQECSLMGILMVIEHERRGFDVDRGILKSLLNMFSSIGIYETSFQMRFLEDTEQFYREESERNLQSRDIPQYLLYCEKRLAEEHDRSEHYLDRMTHRPLMKSVEEQLLKAAIDTILFGFGDLMDANRTDDLGRLYNLCTKVNALEQLKTAFIDYIKSKGLAIMMDEEHEKEMVLLLLDFKSKLDHILVASFDVKASDRNNEFQQALKDAFEKFINQKENKPAELTAKFIDAKLKGGNKGMTEEELEAILDRVLTIFRFIQGKDVFEAFYKKDLAKRLLFGKSSSIDAEKSMIEKLKEECGAQFTTKLEGMFKDMQISKDIMEAFRQSPVVREQLGECQSEMNVQVLTCGYWPTYAAVDARLPDELARRQEIFKDFYLQKHNGRKLQWLNSLGTCLLKAQFLSSTKDLQVNFSQAVVLMLFNDEDRLTFDQIKELSGIDRDELKRVLPSLFWGRLKVLMKEPSSREIQSSDVFIFNQNFQDARFRIRINNFQIMESDQENQKVNDSILQDRQYQIDAAVVRIMKLRKTLSHKLLMNELTSQLRFPFKVLDVKKRIESLIEREYMERTNADPGIYQFIA